ncbi:MAG TPA: S8 family serine peptidase [Candidatus Limnocylindria bacterium]|nr:S8 family serine peptidase [Candidatus Limnocylindria bacterium]
MRRVSVLVVIVMLLTSMFGVSVTQARQGPTDRFAAGRYIVTFADEPVASYDGYEAGFAATRPHPGRKLDPSSPAVQRWQQHLQAKHDKALAEVGATKIYDYTITNNGVAVQLTAAQAAQLAAKPGVIGLQQDELAQPATTSTPEFLGLNAPGGIWSQLAGREHQRAGAGIVVGVVDTGIWPESRSFAGGTGIPIPAGWTGTCVSGENFSQKACNDKLIGARYYVAGFNKHNISKADYLSPRDGNGHGSHTASTAAGNMVSGVAIDGVPFEDGSLSGMAPGAKVAAYKVCWEGKPGINAGCFNSDSVAAINQAVADGVDVINYSIGGSSESSVLDSVEQAFRGASNAGVFVATSAGNSGPGASTFDHPSPWLTTVAATTVRRAFQVVELGNGARYVGASTTPSLTAATQLVTSLSVKLAAADADDAALCGPNTLDPAKAAGKVVQCDRGVFDRIAKSFEVQRAGGVGMVMTNTSPNSLNGDYHPIPSVHVDEVARAAILAYIAAAGTSATAKILPLTAAELAAAPQVPEVAAFSSRGPSVSTEGDFLKPDIAAPGVDIIAAVAPPFHFGRDWDLISGTSMASPHIAGIGALMKALHPTWTPSEIKSALMTSTMDTVSSAGDPFAQGSGFVQPNAAADPGLVYPTSANEYRSFMVSLGVQFAPPFDTLPPISASNLNQASISVGKMAGTETVTRHVKNVSNAETTFTATIDVPGIDAVVTPSTLTLAPNAEATFTVQLTEGDAPLGEWAIGSLTWTGGGHTVRSPVAVQPVVVSAPGEVHVDGVTAGGSTDFEISLGSLSDLDLSVSGLLGVTPTADSVVSGEFDINDPIADADTKEYVVEVPTGTTAARFDLDSDDDTADLDLFVYVEDGADLAFVDLSASGAADEQVTLDAPAEGTYHAFVNGFTTPGGSTGYAITNFVLAPDDLGNLTLSPNPVPAPAALGDPSTVTATWAGLDATKNYFGVISYAGSDVITYFSMD